MIGVEPPAKGKVLISDAEPGSSRLVAGDKGKGSVVQRFLRLIALAALAAAPPPAPAETYRYPRAGETRTVEVTRRYRIPVVPRETNEAGLPAPMSFWGATNQQEILDSEFTYSVQPDKIELSAEYGSDSPRRYKLTWKSPRGRSITVTHRFTTRLTCSSRLYTATRLPYPARIAECFPHALGRTEAINPGNPRIAAIAKEIARKTTNAEYTVQLVCDWVNDHISYDRRHKMPRDTKAFARYRWSDTTLAAGKGDNAGAANVACAILRRLGLPAEKVIGKIIDGPPNAHYMFMEVYFPDAGWVFYDVGNGNRGFKAIDCIMTAGDSFYTTNFTTMRWHRTTQSSEKDVEPYEPIRKVRGKPARRAPKKLVFSARVIRGTAPPEVKIRHLPLRRLMIDLSTPSGPRQYVKPEPIPPKRPTAAGPDEERTSPKTPKRRRPAAKKPAMHPAEAQLRLAHAYLTAGRRRLAATVYRRIVRKYPNSEQAKTAREQLKTLPAPR